MPFSQRSHPLWTSTATRSPTLNSSTPGPSAATVPAYSCPMMNGPSGCPRSLRWRTFTSVPQMEVTLTLSRTSPDPGSGTGRCSTRMSSASCRTTAFIIDATTSRETGVYVDEETAVKGLSVPAAPVGRPPDGHATRGALLDLVLYRRDALEILRDRPQIGLGHVLVAGQRPLDVLAHEPAGHVAIGSIARSEVRDDLLLGPL